MKGRPALELVLRRITGDAFKAPEVVAQLVREEVLDAFSDVSPEERIGLDRMRGNGAVIWADVARAFGELP